MSPIVATILFSIAFISGALLITWLSRRGIYYHAFYGMSKTRRRKIIKLQSRLQYIHMLYLTKYNYPKTTWICLILYWWQCIALLFYLFGISISLYNEEGLHLPRIMEAIVAFGGVSPFVLIHLARFLPKNQKKKNQDRF